MFELTLIGDRSKKPVGPGFNKITAQVPQQYAKSPRAVFASGKIWIFDQALVNESISGRSDFWSIQNEDDPALVMETAYMGSTYASELAVIDDKPVVAGGYSGNPINSDLNNHYWFSNNVWDSIGTLPLRQSFLTAASFSDKIVYRLSDAKTVWTYTHATRQFSTAALPTGDRYGSSFGYWDDTQYIQLGGSNSSSTTFYNDVTLFSKDSHTATAYMVAAPIPVKEASNVVFWKNKIWFYGGRNSSGYSSKAWYCDRSTNLWTSLELPFGRSQLGRLVPTEDRLWFIGGQKVSETGVASVNREIWFYKE